MLVIFGIFTASATVQAKDIGATAEIGPTGVGVHIVVPVKDQLNARFGFNALNHNYSTDTKSAHYDVSLRPRAFDALLDYYPSAGSFRVTGGLVYNKNNKYDVIGKPVVATKYTFVGTLISTWLHLMSALVGAMRLPKIKAGDLRPTPACCSRVRLILR